MTRMEAKAFIDSRVMEYMRFADKKFHFSANLIEKEKWTKKECEETAQECIRFLEIRALKRRGNSEKFLREKRRIEKRQKDLPEMYFKGH